MPDRSAPDDQHHSYSFNFSPDAILQRIRQQHEISKMLDKLRARKSIRRSKRPSISRKRPSRKLSNVVSPTRQSDRIQEHATGQRSNSRLIDDNAEMAHEPEEQVYEQIQLDMESDEEYDSSFIDDSSPEINNSNRGNVRDENSEESSSSSSGDDEAPSNSNGARIATVPSPINDGDSMEQDSFSDHQRIPMVEIHNEVQCISPFDQAKQLQKKLLSEKRNERGTVRLGSTPDLNRPSVVQRTTVAEKWNSYVQALLREEPDFLTSAEAKMTSDHVLRQGVTSYRRLTLNESNCEDVKEIHRLVFKAKSVQGYSNAGYTHFLTAVGQFARMRCAMEADECERNTILFELCNEGNLFRLISSLDHIELFLEYFEARSTSPSTCMGKAGQLLKLSSAARRFHERRGDTREVANVSRVMDKLRSSHSAYKQQSRRKSREKKSIERRKEEGVLMSPSQFMTCKNHAKEKLSGLMSSIRRIKVEKSAKEAQLRLIRDESLMSMWCINFLALVMVCCGGQRPQVFCQLQRLNKRTLRSWGNENREKKYVELATVQEKTSRALDMPFVPFPTSLATILKFHHTEILPILDEKRSKIHRLHQNESDFASKCLVLHSKNVVRLTTKQITETFRIFLFRIDSSLARMTTMNLRDSYATMMLHAHRQGKIFEGESEETFLEFLGKAMNTSVEQLRDTYASVFNEDFNSIANAICDSLQKICEEENRSLGSDMTAEHCDDNGDLNIVDDDCDFF